MSAESNTSIVLKGTSEELLSMLKVLKTYDGVSVKGNGLRVDIDEADEKKMLFLSSGGKKIDVEAFSVFYPGRDDIFEKLAIAAPNAWFNGEIYAMVCGGDAILSGELRDGKLYLSRTVNQSMYEFYSIYLNKKLPYSKFCDIFNVKKGEFDTDSYSDFIMDATEDGFPAEIDYDTFIGLCDGSKIDEDQFYGAIEEVSGLDILDYDSFCDTFYQVGPDGVGLEDDDLLEKRIFDPITKKYERL